jgi:hypothetical protein
MISDGLDILWDYKALQIELVRVKNSISNDSQSGFRFESHFCETGTIPKAFIANNLNRRGKFDLLERPTSLERFGTDLLQLGI